MRAATTTTFETDFYSISYNGYFPDNLYEYSGYIVIVEIFEKNDHRAQDVCTVHNPYTFFAISCNTHCDVYSKRSAVKCHQIDSAGDRAPKLD